MMVYNNHHLAIKNVDKCIHSIHGGTRKYLGLYDIHTKTFEDVLLVVDALSNI